MMLPQLVSAYNFMVDGIAYNYNEDSTSVTVTSGGNYVEAVIIPESVTYDGSTYSVTSIGDYAFSGCRGLTSVIIPNSVTSIGDVAFYYCTGLTSVNIPNSVTTIGTNPFASCSELTSIVVDSGNTIYDSRNNCNAIIETETNTLIAGCKNTTIPNSVTTISDYALYGCSGLTSVTIPNSVTLIGVGAFSYCSLTSVNINDLTAWCNIDFENVTSNPLYYAHNLYLNENKITDLVIPSSVTEIKNNTFSGCISLTSVTLPTSVTSIGEYAFNNCNGLTSVTIPNSVTSIDDYAFGGCTGLTSVTIPNSVTSIGDGVFSGCTGLTSMTIPNSVTSSGGYAFQGCTGLTEVTIGNSVTSIGDHAFYCCTGMTSVIIPNSVTDIGEYAFYGCSGLTSVTIPNSVTDIGEYAFYGCTALTSISIPSSVTNVGGYAFSSWGSFHWQKVEWNVKARNTFISSKPPFYQQVLQIDTLIIGNEVEVIPEHLFVSGQKLTIPVIIIPNTVTSIESNAFRTKVPSLIRFSSLTLTGKGEWNINSDSYPGLMPLISKFKTVNVGSEITSLGDFGFAADSVNCYAAAPPICQESTFANYDGELHVPVESAAAYSAADYWQNFTNRVNDLTEKVFLDQSTASIMKNNTLSLTATSIPEGESIKWSTTNSSVAPVSDDGVVTAVGVGECEIFASLESNYAVYASCHIDVSALNGDVNGDGEVTAADVTALYDVLLNNDYSHVANGDQTGDNDITAADVTAVYNRLLGN